MTDPVLRSGVSGLDRVTFDAGLRVHMQRVFGYMGGGLALSGLLAWAVAHTALYDMVYGTPLRWVFMFAPFGFVMAMNFRMQTISINTLRTLFWLFCGTMGVSLASIFIRYSDASVSRAFFITGAMFGAMSLWGYTTKRDLTSMGAFLVMGFWGLFIASLVNLFMMSSMLQWAVSVAGVAIFTGMTAWNVQNIKQNYAQGWGSEANDKLAVFGALQLYLDFVNLFMSLLRLTGDRR